MRTIAGVIAGLIVGSIAIAIIQQLNVVVFPWPEDFDPQDQEKLKEAVENLSPGASLAKIFGICVGAAVAGGLATLVAKENAMFAALSIGLFYTIGGCVYFFFILPYHQPWVTISSLACPLPMSFLGTLTTKMVQATRLATEPQTNE